MKKSNDSIHYINPIEEYTCFIREERSDGMLGIVLSRVFDVNSRNVISVLPDNAGKRMWICYKLVRPSENGWFTLRLRFINGDWKMIRIGTPSLFVELAYLLKTDVLFPFKTTEELSFSWLVATTQGVLYIRESCNKPNYIISDYHKKYDVDIEKEIWTRLPIMRRSDFFHELKQINSRPAMYLGRKSVMNLEQFINGIYLGIYYSLESLGYKDMYPGNYLGGFDQWLRHRYKVKDMRSMGSILLEQAGEEEKAFDLWFLEFHRYLTEIERLHCRFLKT